MTEVENRKLALPFVHVPFETMSLDSGKHIFRTSQIAHTVWTSLTMYMFEYQLFLGRTVNRYTYTTTTVARRMAGVVW